MNREKLESWKSRFDRAKSAYESELSKMDSREALYKGDNKIRALTKNAKKNENVTAPHVRNICAELIEAQVDSTIPAPKVTARRKEDVEKAKLIEDMLRSELDRMPFEEMNDMMTRTVPIQGGSAFLVEWDHNARTHNTIGELAVSSLHPKQIIPQDGIYSGIADMDYIFLEVPQTKEYIKRKYDVSVADEHESSPDVKGASDASAAEDLVTQIIAYYRNSEGGIGIYSWVNDVELCDIEDYQARIFEDEAGNKVPRGYEEITMPMMLGGEMIEPQTVMAEVPEQFDEMGQPITEPTVQPIRIPYYKPDIYPVILQKNVSVYGKFLGDSDIDKIADQQNTINRIEKKIIDKLLLGGSFMSLPKDASIRVDEDEMKVIRLESPADLQMIGVYNIEGDISQGVGYLSQVYEEGRQIIGVTDSFQGRKDTTATSGKAKEFAAAQTAGRLESKRTMKNAAYAALFEAMFKFRLAYTDEPFPVRREDVNGNVVYEEFNRYDFLERDEAGEWYWNDQFLFSVDASSALASNREAMWQETRLNLQTGAFGDPNAITTLILFWAKMEKLHYPGAGETKRYLEEQQKQQQMQQQMMQAQRMQLAQMQAQQAQANEGMRETADVQAIMAQAKQDAARDAINKRRG